MWKQEFDNMDKIMDSGSGDSGIFSCSNSASFCSSSEFSSNSISVEAPLVSFSEPMKGTDSGFELGLSNSFNQLSLKQTSLSLLESTDEYLVSISESVSDNIDSGIITNSEDISNEPWQLYFKQNEDGDTLLHSAIIQGYLEATLSLINVAPHPCLLDILNYDTQTALHLAVITDQPKVVRKLVLAGADLSIRNYQGNTALHLACIYGNLACTKALTDSITKFENNLSHGNVSTLPQDLEQRNYNGETCLHIAASKGHLDIVKHLVHLGSDLESKESLGGRTPLHLALEHSCLQIVLYLIQQCKPNLDAPTYAGYTSYQLAKCLDEQLARELVKYGATPIDDDYQHSQGFSVFTRNPTATRA